MGELTKALHRYSDALRVAGTDEAADRAWHDFWDDMDAETRRIADRDDFPWLNALARHSFEAGWNMALGRSASLMAKALEEVA